MSKYDVYAYDGRIVCRLNKHLAEYQKVTDEQLCALKVTHQLKESLFNIAKNTNNSLALKALAAVFDKLEFEQQKLWNFGEDANHHYFFDFPGCTCPRLDNLERLGHEGKVYSGNCPIHGDNVKKC